MSLRDQLVQNPSLTLENNIFYQKEIKRPGAFEENYIQLREKESRMYTDEIVKELPQVPGSHPLNKEWRIRKISLEKLIYHLKGRGSCDFVLEIGCGNGWLSHNLAESLKAEVCAMDVNETEILQGARIFSLNQNLFFVYADIFTMNLTQKFDTLILASSIQYFLDLKNLINRLLRFLTPEGEIHILDSPFYPSAATAQAAQKRSQDYFRSLGFPEMTNKYFHHTLQEMNDFNYKILFNPKSFISLINRKILKMSQPVFPWIVIKHP